VTEYGLTSRPTQ